MFSRTVRILIYSISTRLSHRLTSCTADARSPGARLGARDRVAASCDVIITGALLPPGTPARGQLAAKVIGSKVRDAGLGDLDLI